MKKSQLRNIIQAATKEVLIEQANCTVACANPNNRSIMAVDCLSGFGSAAWACATVDSGQIPQVGQVITGFGVVPQPNGPGIPLAYKITQVLPSGTIGTGCPDNATINNGSTSGDCGYECNQGPNYSCSPNYTAVATYSSIQACLNNCDCTNDPASILGCTDIAACNHDPSATCDDGSCCLPGDPTCNGCTDPLACNYDPLVTCDDGSCMLPDGCTNPLSCNYDPLANCDDGSCQQAQVCNTDICVGDTQIIDPLDPCSCIVDVVQILGCMDTLACNYDSSANCDNGTCDYTSCYGCTDSSACNYDPLATMDDGSCILPDGCTDVTACNYNSAALCDDGSCILPDGCTDPLACNYDSTATCDDGSCILPDGCTDVTACNYDPLAACDDGSCILPDGCTDILATNYCPTCVCDDGSCTYPSAACQSGAFPTFGFMNGCDPNAEYLTWPSYYNPPAGSNQFTWYGGNFTHPWNQNPITNGDMLDQALINMLLANQSSYCEWCDDFANNSVNYGGAGNSPQFDDWVTPLWHTPVPIGGPWLPTTGITPPEAHCCCCPGQGGGPMNPGASLLAKMGGSDDELIDPADLSPEQICCNWCATIDPNIPSKPPKGCFDFNCDNCPGFNQTPTILPENFIKRFQKLANISKK